jgi:hypothetical protein
LRLPRFRGRKVRSFLGRPGATARSPTGRRCARARSVSRDAKFEARQRAPPVSGRCERRQVARRGHYHWRRTRPRQRATEDGAVCAPDAGARAAGPRPAPVPPVHHGQPAQACFRAMPTAPARQTRRAGSALGDRHPPSGTHPRPTSVSTFRGSPSFGPSNDQIASLHLVQPGAGAGAAAHLDSAAHPGRWRGLGHKDGARRRQQTLHDDQEHYRRLLPLQQPARNLQGLMGKIDRLAA